MKMLRLALAALIATPALSAPVVPPTVFDAAGNPIRTNPVITVDTTGAYVAGGGGSYTGPAANQLPASLGPKAGASSLSVVPDTDTPFPIVGNVADGATDSGASVKAGCLVNNTLATTFTAGQRAPLSCDLKGAPYLILKSNNGTSVATVQTPSDAAATTSGLYTDSQGMVYNGSTWNFQRGDATGTWIGGHASLATGQVSVGTTSTLVTAARSGRQKIVLSVGAANTCAFGNTGVTTTTGFPLQPTAGATITLDTGAAIYAACSATTTVSFLEQY